MTAVTAVLTVLAALVLAGAVVLILGFMASMLVAAFYVPIETLTHHGHFPQEG